MVVLGLRKMAEMPSLFANQVKTMQQGQWVGPIRAPNGFHIIKLVEVKSDAKEPSSKDIKAMIFQRKMSEQLKEWLQQLRASSYVKITS